MRSRRLVRDVALALVLAALAVFAVTRFVTVPFVVEGESMVPTLNPGDRVLVDLWSYRSRSPRPGEVALLYDPRGVPIVKRVTSGNESAFFVLGDNPGASTDSRAFGSVPRERFRGRVVWRYWPLSRAGRIR